MSIQSMNDSPTGRTYAIEKDANNRVQAAQERVKEANREAEVQINHLRDEYEKRTIAESLRREAAVEAQKLKGYEDLRELKKAQQTEMRNTRRDGDRESAKLGEYYRNTLYSQERNGEEKLRELQEQNTKRLDYEKNKADNQFSDAKVNRDHQIQQVKDQTDLEVNLIKAESDREIEKKRAEVALANEKATETMNAKHAALTESQFKAYDKINLKASQELKAIRQDTASKLAAYSSRQSDPFYQMKDMNASFRETADGFELTITVPEYERKSISALVKGDSLVVSGHRKNEESLEIEPGHKVSSSSYQSFHETFPLTWPVDSRRLTREEVGDQIVFKVPKKNEFVFREPKLPKPERAKVEPPKFPESIQEVFEGRKFEHSEGDSSSTSNRTLS